MQVGVRILVEPLASAYNDLAPALMVVEQAGQC